MAASAWIKFDKGLFYGLDGTVDFSDTAAGVFKCALLTSAWTPATTHDTWADVSAKERAGTYGYTTGGKALTNVALTNTSGTDKWDADDFSWTASGGSISAAYAVIYHVSTGKLLRYCNLDSGAEMTAASGTPFIIYNAAGGIFDVV
jgi:hypothetical protein